MVDIILKLLDEEETVGATDTTVSGSVLFRVYAPETAKITTKNPEGDVVGSMTIPGGFVEIIAKGKADTVSAVPAVLCTPVAYK